MHKSASILMASATSPSSACSNIPSLLFYSLSFFFTFLLFNFTAGQSFLHSFDQDHIQILHKSSWSTQLFSFQPWSLPWQLIQGLARLGVLARLKAPEARALQKLRAAKVELQVQVRAQLRLLQMEKLLQVERLLRVEKLRRVEKLLRVEVLVQMLVVVSFFL
jgi:hypothetical protein